MSLNEIVQTYFPDDLDLVLVEGYKSEMGLKIEIGGDKNIAVKEAADFIEANLKSNKKEGLR